MAKIDTSKVKESSINDLVERARIAQAKYESFSQQQVDAVVRDIGKFVYDKF